MCREQFHRARYWDREAADDEADTEPTEDWTPSYLSTDEPDDDVELLTDGGDGT